MATTEKKVQATQPIEPQAPAEVTAPQPMNEKKAVKGRKSIIEAFIGMKPKERSDIYNELATAIHHDNDLHSQGLEADNSKYEALLK